MERMLVEFDNEVAAGSFAEELREDETFEDVSVEVEGYEVEVGGALLEDSEGARRIGLTALEHDATGVWMDEKSEGTDMMTDLLAEWDQLDEPGGPIR